MTIKHTTGRTLDLHRRHPNRDTRDLDFQVGCNIRSARITRGISQTELADALGLTFQQIQKYENGTNRIGAGRLFRIAGVLKVQVAYFFTDMKPGKRIPAFERREPGDRVALGVMRALAGITGLKKRQAILTITRAIAGIDPAAAE